MSSTARFFCGNAIYGSSGLGNCRMLNFVSIAFCVIYLISMLIRWNHSIMNIFRIKLSRYFVFVPIPTISTVRISNNFVSIEFCVICLIIMLIMWIHSITNICRNKLSRDLVFVSIPTFSSVIDLISMLIRSITQNAMDTKFSIRQFPSPEHPYIAFPQKNLQYSFFSRFTFCKVDYTVPNYKWYCGHATHSLAPSPQSCFAFITTCAHTATCDIPMQDKLF